jgi:membrane protein required for colicin V production
VFTTIDIVYNYERWSINVDKSITFVFVEKGSNYLINEFPTQKEQEDAKEKIKDI